MKINPYAGRLAKAGLRIGAIKLDTINPFKWASGYHMPIYNDNRKFLFDSNHRSRITLGLAEIINDEEIDFDIIAGVATGGIPYAMTLATEYFSPMVYIRSKPKSHGLKNILEGAEAHQLDGKKALVIEDLISAGGSSAKAIQALQSKNCQVEYCLSVFDYEFDKSEKLFQSINCEKRSILTFDILIDVADQWGYIEPKDIKLLKDWKKDPFNWGDNNGFPKV